MLSGLMFFAPASGKNKLLDVQSRVVQTFIQEVSAKHQIAAADLTALLAQSVRITDVEKLILASTPGKPRSWKAYRERFVEPVRLEAGIAFWQQYQHWLERAQTQFGVPPEIIVAIIGVETLYGKHQGNFRVLDVLCTLAFHFPSQAARNRSAFFQTQLEEFLIYTRRSGVSATDIRGSFAGAIGIPQFMPGSINQFAQDFDGDGMIDLHNSVADAIGSVGSFLQQQGWRRGLEPDFPVIVQDKTTATHWLANDLEARHQAAELLQAGFFVSQTPPDYLLGLVDLESPNAPTEYRAGTANFFAITKYNRSFFYAAAVVDLARALQIHHEGLALSQFPTAPK